MLKPRYRSTGFTIVELLIVIVVIGILAAITVVAFNGIQQRARASAASAALNQASKKLALYNVDYSAYPADLATIGVQNDSQVSYQYTVNNTANPKTYCVTATAGNVSYKVTQDTNPTAGGCAGHGQGGQTAITNIIINPSAVNSSTGYNGWAGSGGGSASTSSVTAAWAVRGKAARTTWSVSSSNLTGDIGWSFSNVSGSANALLPNTQYTARWRVNTSKSQRLGAGIVNWCVVGGAANSGTGTVNASSGQVVVPANTPTEQWVTFTTGPNTVCGKLYSNLVSGTGASAWAAGDWIEISELIVVQGATKYNYADGASTDWVWNGTANGSSSTGSPQ